MNASAGDKMLMRGRWMTAVRTEKRYDCMRCAMMALKKRNCADYCEAVDYTMGKEKYIRWEEAKKPGMAETRKEDGNHGK